MFQLALERAEAAADGKCPVAGPSKSGNLFRMDAARRQTLTVYTFATRIACGIWNDGPHGSWWNGKSWRMTYSCSVALWKHHSSPCRINWVSSVKISILTLNAQQTLVCVMTSPAFDEQTHWLTMRHFQIMSLSSAFSNEPDIAA